MQNAQAPPHDAWELAMSVYGWPGLSGLSGLTSSVFDPLSLSPALWLKADAGLVTDGAAQFTAANSEYLSKSSTSSLQTGDIDYWGACWIYKDSNVTAWLMQKGADVGGWEYALEAQVTGTVRFLPMNAGGGSIGGGTTGVLSTGAWHFIFFCYDSVNNLNSISADGGAFTDGAATGVCTAGTGPFILSGYGNIGTPGYYHNGRMDAVCFGKNPTGGIAGIRTAIRDALYNSGSGVRYSSLTTQQKSDWGLQSFWNLDEVSGTRLDSHGSNDLTDNNTVTYAAGIVSGTASADGDPVTTWQDQSGNGRHLSAPTSAKRAVLKTNVKNSRPCVLFDGVDDYFDIPNFMAGLTEAEVFIVAKTGAAAATLWYLGSTHAQWWPWTNGAVYEDFGTTARKNTVLYLTANTWYLYGAQSASGSHVIRCNGSDGDNLTTNTYGADTALTLGKSEGGAAPYFGSYIAEMLIFPRVLTLSERLQVENYLNNRWGLYSYSTPVAGNYPEVWLKADAGLVTDGAAQFTAASSQSLSVADNANFAFTTAFSTSFWVKRNAVTGFETYICKWTYPTDGGWVIQSGVNSYADLCVFLAGSAGDAGTNGLDFTDVDMAANTWYHVAVIYDGSLTGDANRLKCYVNGVQKTPNFVFGAIPASLQADGAPLRLGAWSGSLTRYLDGYLDNVRIWSRAITSDEVASEYASGAGRNYSAMSTSDKVSLVCAYDFASPGAGLVADSHGSNTLTNNNTVTYAAGIVSGTAVSTGDAVTTWQDQSGHARHFTVPTATKRPTFSLSVKNGLPAVLFDGVDDYLTAAVSSMDDHYTVVIVGKATGAGLQYYFDGVNNNAAITNDSSTTHVLQYSGASLIKTGLTADAWRMIVAIFNGANSELHVDNLAAVTGNAGSTATGSSLYLGRYGIGGSGVELNGYLGEVLVFRSIISSTFRASLQAYLNARWGVY